MFDIVLQTNNSENNRVTKDVTDIATISGTLKNDSAFSSLPLERLPLNSSLLRNRQKNAREKLSVRYTNRSKNGSAAA
jgi:hypothetical protein